MMRHPRLRLATMLLASALMTAACGSSLTHDEILAENIRASGGGGAAAPDVGPSNDDPTATTLAGGETPGSGAAVAAGPSGGAPSGSAATSGGGPNAGPSAAAGPATGSEVVIGQLSTNSGVVGQFLGGIKVGAQIWAQWVNQHGGLNGHKVRLVTVDDGGDPSTARAQVRRLVEEEGAIAFVATLPALTSESIRPYVEEMQVPIIGGENLVPAWYESPMFFPSGASQRVQTAGTINEAIRAGFPKVANINCVEFALVCENSERIVKADTPSLGGEVSYTARVSLAQPDFTSQCIGAKNAGAQAVWIAADPGLVIRFANSCRAQGYTPQFAVNGLIFGDTLKSPSTIGAIGTSSVFPYVVDSPETAGFRQASEQATGGPPKEQLWANAWVAGKILELAAANLPADNPTSADLLDGLYKIQNNNIGGLTAPLTYVRGKPTVSPVCYYLGRLTDKGVEAPNGLKTNCLDPRFSAPR